MSLSSDFPWLAVHADAGRSLSAGASAGAAISNAATERRRQSFSEMLETEMLPLRKTQAETLNTLRQAQIKSAQLNNEAMQRSLSDELDNRQSMSALFSGISRASKADLMDDPGTESMVWGAIAKNPRLASTPQVQGIFKDINTARVARAKQSQLDQTADQKAAIAGMEQEALNRRAQLTADTRTATTETTANSRVAAAMARANNWKNHAQFTAFKASVDRAAKLAANDDEFAKAVEDAERRFGPTPSPGSPFATEPPAPTSPAGKVRVKSPDGKTGFVPAEQLQDALKQGYQKLE